MIDRNDIKHQAMLRPDVAKADYPNKNSRRDATVILDRPCEKGGTCEMAFFNVWKCIKCNKPKD